MNVLITGGAGFIGSNLTDALLARGDKVSVIDNFSTARRDNLSVHKNLSVVEGDICDKKSMEKLVSRFQPNVVVHAAASYKDPNAWGEDAQSNVNGTAVLCEVLKEAGVNRIIYFQTALCYGLEPLENPITLGHPILPEGSSYAISKTAAEQYIHLSALDYVTFRLANVYGPRNISGPLPTFYKRLTSNQPCFIADTRRDFIYIKDLLACVVKAIDGVGSGTYHVSSGSDISIKELFDAVTTALGMDIDLAPSPRQPDDVYSILLDPTRTKQDFSWEAEINLVDGVRETIEYYKRYGVSETFTHLKQIDVAMNEA